MFANSKRPPTVVRTVSLPAKKHTDKSRSSTPRPGTPNNAPSPKPATHLNPHKNNNVARSKHTNKPHRSSPSVKSPPLRSTVNALKRKAPEAAVQFDEDSDTEQPSDLDFALASKRVRPDSPAIVGASRDEGDAQRVIFDLAAWKPEEEDKWPIVHGAEMTNGEHAKEYRAAFGEGEMGTVGLRYPSSCLPER
jgi:hypothetical protein